MNSRIFFASLGCDKNLVDTEVMLGLLAQAGYELTSEESEADIIVVNTCCFIGDAKEESIETILDLARYKETGNCRGLIVTGCLAERYREEILREMPEVDAVVGTSSYDDIVRVVYDLSYGEKRGQQVFHSLAELPQPDTKRVLTTGGHYAFLKIAEGCDKCCTYCIIPKVRGRYRSFPMERLVHEAEELAEQGVRELILVAQETTLYGTDLYGEKKLPELLARLSEIRGVPLDPYPVLLPRGDHRRPDRGDPGSAEGLPLSGYPDSARQRYDAAAHGTPDRPEEAHGDHREAAPGDPGHRAADHSDHGLSRRDGERSPGDARIRG